MVQSREHVDLSTVVGRNLRRVREDIHEASQDELAAELRAHGLDWNRSQLAKAERGERRFTFEQVLLIAAALNVNVAELVSGQPNEKITVGDDVVASPALLTALVDGTAPHDRPGVLEGPETPRNIERMKASNEYMRKVIADSRPTDAERRLAGQLNTTPNVVGQCAFVLWGQPFLTERGRRFAEIDVDGGSATAVRGHITRSMIEELRPLVEKKAVRKRTKKRGDKRRRGR